MASEPMSDEKPLWVQMLSRWAEITEEERDACFLAMLRESYALNCYSARMLSRPGVTFSAQQKEQIKNLIAAGDTAGGQQIILEHLTAESEAGE